MRAEAPPPGGSTRVLRGDLAVAVFDLDGELLALDDRCLHKGGSLSRGWVRDGVVTCPEHWWRYDLRSGGRLGAPELCLRRYPIERDGTDVVIALPDEPDRPRSLRERLLEHAREWESRP